MPKPEIDERYLDYSDLGLIPAERTVMVQQHRPKAFTTPYHHHASVELNFVTNCVMEYSFSGAQVQAPVGRPILFWGALPHSVINVSGKGEITNLYIAFSQLLQWQLPEPFIDALIRGDVLSAQNTDPIDALQFARWAKESRARDRGLDDLHRGEVEMRLRRFALSPWERLLTGRDDQNSPDKGVARIRYIEEILRFISENYASPISVSDVADHVNLSPNYAMTLFKQVIGVPIKEHIIRIRLSHAQMLLATSDSKIVSVAMDSGFGSLSSFYEAFQARNGQSPAAFRRSAHRGSANR